MSENNTQKIITDVIFKSAIEKILTEISNYIYEEEPYTDLEIDDMFNPQTIVCIYPPIALVEGS